MSHHIKKIIKLIEQLSTYPFEWNTKTIIWSDGDFFIATNNPERNTYLTLWTKDNKQIGKLAFDEISKGKRYNEYAGNWYKVSVVDIQKNFRGNGLGKQLYKTALEWMPSHIKGIYSYLPDTVNKKQVPSIHKSLGGKVIDGDDLFISKDKDIF